MMRWRRMALVLLVCLLGFATGGHALAGQETLRVMVYDRQDMNEEYGTSTQNQWTQYIRQKVSQKLGFQVEFVSVSRVNDLSEMSVLLQGGFAPDILFTYDEDYWIRQCESGLTADLTNAIAQYGPNIQKYLGDMLPYGQYDGRSHAICNKRGTTEVTSGFLRKDWADKLGIALRRTADGGYALTTEELYEMLKRFQQENLGGLGRDAPAFLSYGTTCWPVLLMLEAFYNQQVITPEDLYALPFFLLDGAKEGYRYLNRLYHDGLLNKDFPFIGDSDKSGYISAIIQGQIGFWINDSWFGFTSDETLLELYNNDPSAEVVALDILNANGDPAYKYTYRDYGLIIFVPSQSTHIKEAIQYLDYLSIPQNDLVLRYGFEGEHYQMVNGLPTAIDSKYNEQTRISVSDLALMYNGYATIAGDDPDLRRGVAMLPEKLRELRRQSSRVAMANSFQLPFVGEYVPEKALYSAQLSKLETELRIRVILCEPASFDQTWERCVDNYLASGGDTLIHALRAAYRRSAE